MIVALSQTPPNWLQSNKKTSALARELMAFDQYSATSHACPTRRKSLMHESETIILFFVKNGIYCRMEHPADVKEPIRGSRFPAQEGELPLQRRCYETAPADGLEMRILCAMAITLIVAEPALAETIGVSMARFDDNFLTVLRNGMRDHATSKSGVSLQMEDAQNDVSKQLGHVQNFIAQGVDAIIVNPVDTDATPGITKLAIAAGVPLVYVNRMPVDNPLPAKVSFVGSNEVDSGTLAMQEVCRLMAGKGSVVVLMGELSNQAARQRTQDVHDVIVRPECAGIRIVEEQTGNWDRIQGQDLMTNWISSGVQFDAVISNNDEMAIGAIQALKAAGYNMSKVIVAGIDATQDALAAMKAGDLDVTVFQNAAAQGAGAVDAALKLAKDEDVTSMIWIPFELVTPANMDQYLSKN